MNGTAGVGMQMRKQSGTNTVEVVDRLYGVVNRLRAGVTQLPGALAFGAWNYYSQYRDVVAWLGAEGRRRADLGDGADLRRLVLAGGVTVTATNNATLTTNTIGGPGVTVSGGSGAQIVHNVITSADTGIVLLRGGEVLGAYTRQKPELEDAEVVYPLAREADAEIDVHVGVLSLPPPSMSTHSVA